MARIAVLWAVSLIVTLPLAVVLDRRARSERVPDWRRRLAFALTLLASPLGLGLWLGLVHRSKGSVDHGSGSV